MGGGGVRGAGGAGRCGGAGGQREGDAREREREDAAPEVADPFETGYKDPIKVIQALYGYEPPPPPPLSDAPTPAHAPAPGSVLHFGIYRVPRELGPAPSSAGALAS